MRNIWFSFLLLILGVAGPSAARAETWAWDGGDVVGQVFYYVVQPRDTLFSVARAFDVGIVAMMSANPGVSVLAPPPGTSVVVPALNILPPVPRKGIVVNLSEMRLYYFPDAAHVMTFPIGVGREGWETVEGTTFVTKKRDHPVWIPPDSLRAEDPTLPAFVPSGPDNPLGDYALNLGFPGYLIHGTRLPRSIGRRSSHGCMRLYPEDIEKLFNAVAVGTPVNIIDRPYKIGRQGGRLMLQVSPSQAQSDDIIRQRPLAIADIPQVYGDIKDRAGSMPVDWDAVREAVRWRTGLPVTVAPKEAR